MIKRITTEDLRRMKDREGFILQSCGSDVQEWVDGINKLLTDNGILQNGAEFTDVSAFEHNGATNLLFPLDGMNAEKLDVAKLAAWRLQTRGTFGGVWLSDYLTNEFGIDVSSQTPSAPSAQTEHERVKPEAPIIGADGNVFNLIGIVSNALKRAGLREEAAEMRSRVMDSGSYGDALAIMTEYVEPVSVDEYQEFEGMKMGM
jgi:hypothetical protein